MNLEKKKRTPNLKTFEAKHVGVGEVNALEQELGNAILCHEPVASFGNSKQMKWTVLQQQQKKKQELTEKLSKQDWNSFGPYLNVLCVDIDESIEDEQTRVFHVNSFAQHERFSIVGGQSQFSSAEKKKKERKCMSNGACFAVKLLWSVVYLSTRRKVSVS